MTKLLTLLRDRSREQGYTLIEIMVAISLMSILTAISLTVITGVSKTSKAFAEYEAGVNQGVVNDSVRSAFDAAQSFHRDYPDVQVTTQNLSNYGYAPTDIPSTVEWGVGQTVRNTNNALNTVCATAYSLTEDNGKFTSNAPVQMDIHFQGQWVKSQGCWGYNDEGRWVSVADL